MVTSGLERQGERRDDRIDPRAVAQPGIDHRRGFVDAAAERRDDALDDAEHRAVAGEVVGCGAMRPPRSTKIWSKRLTADLVLRLVGEQGLERSEADGLVEHLAAQLFAVEPAWKRGLGGDDLAIRARWSRRATRRPTCG